MVFCGQFRDFVQLKFFSNVNWVSCKAMVMLKEEILRIGEGDKCFLVVNRGLVFETFLFLFLYLVLLWLVT